MKKALLAILAALLFVPLAPSRCGVPVGTIVMWYGDENSVPTGWQICDGTNGTPDLRDRFIVGAGNDYEVGDVGGSETNDLSHVHGAGTLATDYGPPFRTVATGNDWQVNHSTHKHTITGDTAEAGNERQENRPPYYALAYIMYMPDVYIPRDK